MIVTANDTDVNTAQLANANANDAGVDDVVVHETQVNEAVVNDIEVQQANTNLWFDQFTQLQPDQSYPYVTITISPIIFLTVPMSYFGNCRHVTRFTCNNSILINLNGIEALEQLEHLEINNSPLQDISAVTSCANLKSIRMVNNKIHDISAILQLGHLTHATFTDNRISSLVFLKSAYNQDKLLRLSTLILNNNQITSHQALNLLYVPSLAVIMLSNNLIATDISRVFRRCKMAVLEHNLFQ
ncbi:Hypothetical protein MVR_LOCUS308 [uncultured virus]|nr:Hypothetical protein MVR_LOCUS308 [uncultured virus]